MDGYLPHFQCTIDSLILLWQATDDILSPITNLSHISRFFAQCHNLSLPFGTTDFVHCFMFGHHYDVMCVSEIA